MAFAVIRLTSYAILYHLHSVDSSGLHLPKPCNYCELPTIIHTHTYIHIYHAIACIYLYKLLFLNGLLFFNRLLVEGIKVFALDLFYALGARLDVVFLQLKSLCYQNLVLFIWYPSCALCQNWNKWIARICLTISAVWYNYVTYSSLSECVMAAVPIFFFLFARGSSYNLIPVGHPYIG